MPNSPPSSILIVRLSAIGDVIHTLPVLEEIRRQLPQAKIGWLVEELSAPLLKHHPDIHTVYTVPKKRWRKEPWKSYQSEIRPFFKQIKQDGWEAAIDFQGLLKSSAAAWMSGAPLRVGLQWGEARESSWLLTNKRVARQPTDLHVVQRNLRLLEGIGLKVPETAPHGSLHFLPEEVSELQKKLESVGWKGEPLAAINPGAGWPTKRWPAKEFAQFARLLQHNHGLMPLILWGPGEEAVRDAIAAGMGATPHLIAPPTRIRELAVMISQCAFFVGGDTGASHMAATLHVPVLSIFGASDAQRNQPWPVSMGHPVHRKDLTCLPCWKTKCPLEGNAFEACMHGLEANYVYTEAQKWIDSLGFKGITR